MSTKAEAIKVDSKNIACDGGAGQLGHPRVFLAFDDDQKATCPIAARSSFLKQVTVLPNTERGYWDETTRCREDKKKAPGPIQGPFFKFRPIAR